MNLDELIKLEAAMPAAPWEPSRYVGDIDGYIPEPYIRGPREAVEQIAALRNNAKALIAAAKDIDRLAALLSEANAELDQWDQGKQGRRNFPLEQRIDAALARLEGEKK